ncbi:MAG: hypothetical protein HYS12_27170 [Planctomycetes bacterium]|nr:hypothetical protein [Planctomycetota bacterium]
MSVRSAVASLLAVFSAAGATAQVVPPGDKAPILRLEAGGPTAYVTALAFSPDGKRLYAAGFDKVVRVWVRDERGQFRLARVSYRIPVGPGVNGAINALAVSPDGSRLAVGGQGVYRGLAAFGQVGYGWPVVGALDLDKRRDQGTIYVFNTNDNSASLLRGHTGPIIGMAFAPFHPRKPALLVSAALDWDERKGKSEVGLRLWDVAEGTSLARTAGDLPDLALLTRPDLATWHSGNAAREVSVGLSWGDKHLSVWEAGRSRLLRKEHDRTALRVAVLPSAADRPQGDRLLTAASAPGGTHLQLWEVRGGEPPRLVAGGAPEGHADSFPGALALLRSRPGEPADHAAVVVRRLGKKNERVAQPDEYSLEVHDIRGDTFGAVRSQQRLWEGVLQPALAVSATGDFLAVAGSPDHSILVYSVPDLLGRRGKPQKLGGLGEIFRNAAFIGKGKECGLVLSTEPKDRPGLPSLVPADGTLIFDFDNRRPSADREGWKTDAPDVGDWRVKWSGPAARGALHETLTVSEDGKELCTVRLYPNYNLSDFALLPPRPPLRIPLLAVASQRRGLPLLALYNARTGEQLRDLIIEGVVEDGKLKELTRPEALYEMVDRKDPGQRITLRVRRGTRESGSGDVTVKVGQGFDTRNPLLSLFVTRKTDGDERQWIGWSPLGPYDVSGQRAEALLGWHLNTGVAEAPAQFAPAGEYRRLFYRQGLLKELITSGDLPPRRRGQRDSRPEIGLVIVDDGKLPSGRVCRRGARTLPATRPGREGDGARAGQADRGAPARVHLPRRCPAGQAGGESTRHTSAYLPGPGSAALGATAGGR